MSLLNVDEVSRSLVDILAMTSLLKGETEAAFSDLFAVEGLLLSGLLDELLVGNI